MAKKHKKKHRLEKAALIVSIINGLVIGDLLNL